MAPLVFRAARRKLLVLLLGSLAFVASGVFILVTGRGVGPTLTGLAGIAFFGMCAVVAIVQLFDARPRLVIDERGVLDRTLKVGIITWADILDAEPMRVSNQPFIARKLRIRRSTWSGWGRCTSASRHRIGRWGTGRSTSTSRRSRRTSRRSRR